MEEKKGGAAACQLYIYKQQHVFVKTCMLVVGVKDADTQ